MKKTNIRRSYKALKNLESKFSTKVVMSSLVVISELVLHMERKNSIHSKTRKQISHIPVHFDRSVVIQIQEWDNLMIIRNKTE